MASPTSRLHDFNIEIEPLFKVVKVHDPANPHGRQAEIVWWPTKLIKRKQLDCQRHFDNCPGTYGPTHPNAKPCPAGDTTTIEYLWENRSDPEVVAAILITASLFPRMEAKRYRYPEKWPSFPAARVLADWAYTRWLNSKYPRAWHHSCSTVIPHCRDDDVYKIDSMEALIHYLAEEHAELLLNFSPVVVEFSAERDPFIANTLQQEYKAAKQHQIDWEARRKAEAADEKLRVEAIKVKHPRYGEWNTLFADELELLVWTKPATKIAQDFGVSDVAVGKRCRALNIAKPPGGFWSRVAAGKIPHPEGNPPIKRTPKPRPKLSIVP